ncbi:MAG: twin-arginine translocase subunit TatA [Thiothrix sp.]|nr:MAG: twin-arginine translocase subunit TatA [Thiothrix sp.]
MGFGGISPWSLLLILLIVVLLFGTKRLKSVGGDLGGAIKNFKKSMIDGDKNAKKDNPDKLDKKQDATRVVDGEVKDAEVVEGKINEKEKV